MSSGAVEVPSVRARSSGRRLILMALAGGAMSAACIAVLAGTTDVNALARMLGGADTPILALAVVSLAVSMVVRSARWSVLLVSAGPHHVSAFNALPVVLLGYAANAILPARLGDPARALVAAGRFRIGVPEALGSVALERVVDVWALAAVGLIASAAVVAPSWLTQTSLLLVIGAASIVTVVHWGGRMGQRLPTWTNPNQLRSRIVRGLRAGPRAVLVSLGLGGVAWCLDGLTFWIAASAIGVDVGWEATVLIAAGAAIGGVLPSAPAGLGTFELAGTAVGTAIGLPPTVALGVVVLGHAVTVVPLIVAGLLSAAWLGLDVGSMRSASALARRDAEAPIAAEGGR